MSPTDHVPEQLQALSLLQTAVNDGRIDLKEFDRRSQILVEGGPEGLARAMSGIDSTKIQAAQPRSPSRQSGYALALRIEWAARLGVSLINLTVWITIFLTVTPVYFWPAWVIGPWGIALSVRQIVELVRRKKASENRYLK